MLYTHTISRFAGVSAAALLASCGGGGGDSPTSPGGGGGGGTGVIASVSINGNVTSITVGATSTFTATARDVSGSSISSAAFTWSSSNPAVASIVAGSGVATGVAAGTAVITASSSGVTGTRALVVSGSGGGTVFPDRARIDMPDLSYVPNDVHIARNGTIDFVFTAVAHDVVFSGTGKPNDIPVTSNATVSRTFSTAGVFTIVCTLHAGMNGQVTVH